MLKNLASLFFLILASLFFLILASHSIGLHELSGQELEIKSEKRKSVYSVVFSKGSTVVDGLEVDISGGVITAGTELESGSNGLLSILVDDVEITLFPESSIIIKEISYKSKGNVSIKILVTKGSLGVKLNDFLFKGGVEVYTKKGAYSGKEGSFVVKSNVLEDVVAGYGVWIESSHKLRLFLNHSVKLLNYKEPEVKETTLYKHSLHNVIRLGYSMIDYIK